MNTMILRELSHPFEGEMLRDMLKGIEIESWVADKNGPQNMEAYLGIKKEKTYLFVKEEDFQVANDFLNAEIQDTMPIERVLPPVRFPYWIIIGFTLMLLIGFIAQKFWS
jgi:hypothetical protein